MNFIQVSCLVAQAQCLTNWGDCGLLYNAYLKNLQPFTRKSRGFCFTLCTLSYLIPILQWCLIWGWILRTDSPLFRTSFSKAFQCSCAFFEYAFQIIMQVVSLSMLALQTVCCHNFSFYFFIVRNATPKIYVMTVVMKVHAALQIYCKKCSRRQDICSKSD